MLSIGFRAAEEAGGLAGLLGGRSLAPGLHPTASLPGSCRKAHPPTRPYALVPSLQAYAASFVAVPFVRFLLNQGRNAAIDERNEARKQALALLEKPDATLRSKLAGAARKGQQRVVADRSATQGLA